MVDQTVVPPARTGEWRVKWGMGQLRLLRAAAGFVLFGVAAMLAAPSPAQFAHALMQRAGDANAAPAGAAASAKRLSAAAPAHKPQASEVQTYPERPTPSQPAVPSSPSAEKTPWQTPKTEMYTLSDERYEKAIAYSRAEYVLYFVSYLLGVFVLFVLLRFGIAAKMRNFAERKTPNHWLQGLIFVPLLFGVLDLCSLPIHLYGHSLSLRFEQSVEGWAPWFWDWTKSELLGIGAAILMVMVLFRVMRWSPRRWWFFFWVAALPILLFIFFISPWFVDPMFNTFHPLAEKYPALAADIEKVVQRTGLDIPPDRMFLMDASKKTNDVNAYVTGFGASKRIVVWDTTVQKLTTDETMFIFGHEAGHYVLNHIRNGFTFFAVGLLAALFVGYRVLNWVLAKWGRSWGIEGPEDWASLAAMLLILELLVFLSMPIENGYSRMQEHNADVYGLEVIHGIVPNSAEVAAHSFQILGEIGLADPNPPGLITFWLYSHPPLAQRLVFAHTYDPWSKGEAPKYVKTAPASSPVR
jgi:STE24 endopeptidase